MSCFQSYGRQQAQMFPMDRLILNCSHSAVRRLDHGTLELSLIFHPRSWSQILTYSWFTHVNFIILYCHYDLWKANLCHEQELYLTFYECFVCENYIDFKQIKILQNNFMTVHRGGVSSYTSNKDCE